MIFVLSLKKYYIKDSTRTSLDPYYHYVATRATLHHHPDLYNLPGKQAVVGM